MQKERSLIRLEYLLFVAAIAISCSSPEQRQKSNASEPTKDSTDSDKVPDRPKTSVFCDKSLIPRMGYAAYKSVTGGNELCNTPTVVTNTKDDGPGSLRQALKSDRYITFSESLRGQEIELESDIVSRSLSNLTIDGRDLLGEGLGISIRNRALKFSGPENLIIGHIGFINNNADGDTDGLTIRGLPGRTPSFYIGHNTFVNAADGALDIIWKRGQDMWGTLEANKFQCNNKTMLIDSSGEQSDEEGATGRYYITIFQNWFNENTQRQPLARTTDLHYINNVITMQSQGGKGPNAARATNFLIENNAFESGPGGLNCGENKATGNRFVLVDGPNANVTVRGNVLLNGGSGIPYNDDEQGLGYVENALAPPYPYQAIVMDASLMSAVMINAGY